MHNFIFGSFSIDKFKFISHPKPEGGKEEESETAMTNPRSETNDINNEAIRDPKKSSLKEFMHQKETTLIQKLKFFVFDLPK